MIEKDNYVDAPPHVVYAFLTEPAKMMEWIGIEVEIDPRPGGIFRVVPNHVDVIRGTVIEAVPYSKVSFTWDFEGEGHAVQQVRRSLRSRWSARRGYTFATNAGLARQ